MSSSQIHIQIAAAVKRAAQATAPGRSHPRPVLSIDQSAGVPYPPEPPNSRSHAIRQSHQKPDRCTSPLRPDLGSAHLQTFTTKQGLMPLPTSGKLASGAGGGRLSRPGYRRPRSTDGLSLRAAAPVGTPARQAQICASSAQSRQDKAPVTAAILGGRPDEDRRQRLPGNARQAQPVTVAPSVGCHVR